VAIFVTNHTSTGNMTLNRGRIVASTIGKAGGGGGGSADIQDIWIYGGI
jgi:hypothetical protein